MPYFSHMYSYHARSNFQSYKSGWVHPSRVGNAPGGCRKCTRLANNFDYIVFVSFHWTEIQSARFVCFWEGTQLKQIHSFTVLVSKTTVDSIGFLLLVKKALEHILMQIHLSCLQWPGEPSSLLDHLLNRIRTHSVGFECWDDATRGSGWCILSLAFQYVFTFDYL